MDQERRRSGRVTTHRVAFMGPDGTVAIHAIDCGSTRLPPLLKRIRQGPTKHGTHGPELVHETWERRGYWKVEDGDSFPLYIHAEAKKDPLDLDALERLLSKPDDGGHECRRCHAGMLLRDGDDPTAICDHCAHELVPALLTRACEVTRLRKALEKIAKRGARGLAGDELSACGNIAHSALAGDKP